MRVALLSRAVFPLHGYGGLERHVASLEKHLRLAGCEVTLFTSPPVADDIIQGRGAPPPRLSRPPSPSGYGGPAEASAEAGRDSLRSPCARVEDSPTDERERREFVLYRRIPWPRRNGFVVLDRDTNYLAWSVSAARRLLERGGFDIVQADGGAGFGYAVVANAESPPFLLHPHGMEEFKAPAVKRALYLPLRSATRFAARRAARVLAPDRSMKEDVKRNLGVEDERMAVVPNAIDLSDVDRDVPAIELGIPREVPVLLSVGRLEANKGFSFLARALSRLPRNFLWVLVGEGPERTKIESEIARHGLDTRVRLTGRASDDELHALYERCDLFVHPTLYEGSSMVTLEAMAHGKPVVATRVGGIPDKVLDGENGLLVPPAEAEALSAAIADALAHGDRRRAWGRRGRALVEERFSWTLRVKELVALYREILRSR